MEGGVKRGLKGAVVAGDEGKVQIVASGPVSRLQSFAEWCSNQLSSEVDYYVDLDACPTVNLSPKFKLDTTAGADNEKWAELLAAATMDVEDASGKSHSSDEGLV